MSVDVRYELDLGQPSQDLLQWAQENLDEDPETRQESLKALRTLIYVKEKCTSYRTDDSFLLRFLRARYFKVDRAHTLFVKYYNFKENNPQLCKNVDVYRLIDLGLHKVISVPPYTEASGRRLLHYKVSAWDPKECTLEEMFQATLAILEIAVMEQRCQILGGILLGDFEGLSLEQISYVTLSLAHKAAQIMASSFPIRVHAIHIINQPSTFNIVYNLIKPFLKESLKKRFFFHGNDRTSLYKHIDPKYLPKAYGGIHPEYNYKEWIEFCEKDKNIVAELRDLGYILKKLDEKL